MTVACEERSSDPCQRATRRGRRRHGAGTLLITVMVVLASLFIMAMMQFFAATVSRGRHVLHRLTLTDYMAESALQEAVTFFNASVNRFGKPGGTPDPNLMKLQAALIESFKGGGDNVADAEFEPVLTRKLYDEILNYGDMNDFIPKVTIRLVRQEEANPFSSDTKYGTGGLAYFSVTVVHKDPGLRNTFKGSHKTVTRAYQFRHYMMAPPTDWVLDSTALREHRVIARNFAYARTRVKQHYDDFSSLVKTLNEMGHKVAWSVNLLAYAIAPEAVVTSPGSWFESPQTLYQNTQSNPNTRYVGIKYAALVKQAATARPDMSFSSGDATLTDDLSTMAGLFNNQEGFTFDNLQNMAMNYELGTGHPLLNLIGDDECGIPKPANLEDFDPDTEDFPKELLEGGADACATLPAGSNCCASQTSDLANNASTCTTPKSECSKATCRVGQYNTPTGGRFPLKRWDKTNVFDNLESSPFQFRFGEKTPTTIASLAELKPDPPAVRVIGGQDPVSYKTLRVFVQPPPVLPPAPAGTPGADFAKKPKGWTSSGCGDVPPPNVAPGGGTTGPGNGQGQNSSSTQTKTLDELAKDDANPVTQRVAKALAGIESDSSHVDEEIRADFKDGPAAFRQVDLKIDVPPTTHDWAFRINPDYYKDSFAQLTMDVQQWRGHNKDAVEFYKTRMREGNADSKFDVLDETTLTDLSQWHRVTAGDDVFKKAATYIFPNVDAMKKVIGVPDSSGNIPDSPTHVYLNGMYYLEDAKTPLTLTKYTGQGIIVGRTLDIAGDNKRSMDAKLEGGQSMFVSLGKGIKISGDTDGIVMSMGVVSVPDGDEAKITGMLVTNSLVSRIASDNAMDDKEPDVSSEQELKSSTEKQVKDDEGLAAEYHSELPKFTINYDEALATGKEETLGHVVLTPYRIAQGSVRTQGL